MKEENARFTPCIYKTIIMFLFILITTYSETGFSYNKEAILKLDKLLFKSEGLHIYREQHKSLDDWCLNTPTYKKMNISFFNVFYDTSHKDRLKRMQGSYKSLVKNMLIPAIKKTCGTKQNLTGRYIMIMMYKMSPSDSDPKVLVDYPQPLWDILTFKIQKSDVLYVRHEPKEANYHLTRNQIEASIPDLQKKESIANMKIMRDKQARMEAAAEARRKANDGFGRCRYGCVSLCNASDKTYTIATAHEQHHNTGGNRSGIINRVEIEGWWELKPDKCYKPQMDLYWQTYYSVSYKSSSGQWTYPKWSIKETVLDGKKGMSGYSNASFCIIKSKHFRRHISGGIRKALNEACPPGYIKAPVNLFTRGQVDYETKYKIK